jgi:hypothetical protein
MDTSGRAREQAVSERATVAEQIDTTLTTTRAIMGSVGFAAGVADVRAGKPARFDSSFDADVWTYERGRLWAYLAPVSMPLRIGRRLNPEALRLFDRAWFAKEIV